MPVELTPLQMAHNMVDALVAVLLDGYEPEKVLRAYADGLHSQRDRRDVFRRAAVKGIDLRTPRERRAVGIGRIGATKF